MTISPSLSKRATRRVLFTLVFSAAIAGSTGSAAQEPFTLTGSIQIGLSTGSLTGDFCLHDLSGADTVRIVLNRSLEVLRVRGAESLVPLKMDEPGGFATRYAFHRTGPLQEPLCLEYAGSEPIHDVEQRNYREDDSSHVIAFNGSSVRARGAARWYPAIFDTGLGTLTEAERFRITVLCQECRWIYLNGSEPLPGPLAAFESSSLREPYLLAGDFPVISRGADHLIGQAVPTDSLAAFFQVLSQIRSFHEEYLGVPYDRDIILTQVAAVREPRRGRLWGFYSDPSLTLIGMSIPELVAGLEGSRESTRRQLIGFLAHELAHRYFGWGLGWRSSQRELFGEPFATYLELKAVRYFLGEEHYERAVESLARRVARGGGGAPLDLAGPAELNVDSYRYGYAPLQLIALEHIIGEPLTRVFLRGLVTAPAADRATADFTFMRRIALEVGVSSTAWQRWVDTCLRKEAGEADCPLPRPEPALVD